MNIRDPGFYYNDATNFISDRIFECLNEGLKSNYGRIYWNYPIQILDESHFVNYRWSTIRVNQDCRWDVIGFAGPDEAFEPSIEVNFLLAKGVWSRKAGITKASIINVVAHELHHIAQNYDGTFVDSESQSFSYFMLPHEIEAFHVGFRAEANFTGQSMKSLMQDYLSGWVASKQITKKESKKIIEAWLNPSWECFDD